MARMRQTACDEPAPTGEGSSLSTGITAEPGLPLPLGVNECCDGFNFSLFSRHATRICLDLFSGEEDSIPRATLELDPRRHRTGDIWHVKVRGIGYGQAYALRVDGPFHPEQGHRFNHHKALLDPYATALVGTARWDFACICGCEAPSTPEERSFSSEDDARWKPNCLIVDRGFDWQGDLPPRHAWADTVIYETHVRGLTVHPSSVVTHPGTFLGVAEKIPYLKELGITAVELMPVQEFYEHELVRRNPLTGEKLRNYWGYSTVAFFAPKESYSTRSVPGVQVTEFKTLVRELHRAGIEVILDIVFNHTAEGNESGPTLNFRGLDNRIYYMLAADRRYYQNYSGCGNTLNCSHPVVRDYILDCLRYWVTEMHVDGFRFDLASVMGRDAAGNLLPNPPLLERIAEDPILRDVKLIAEAWDAGGAYQVGSFPGRRWSEWNGRYRDEVRRFWRGDPGMMGVFASRICGSADIYQRGGKEPLNSINFVTCHDGFTLNDLVSFASKHNEANGEENRDGSDVNFSANYGVEGESDDPDIAAVRLRQIKNLLATLLISRGVPMLLGGDEFRRSQAGNNNAYCQDSELSWYDWRLVQRHWEVLRFTHGMIAFRRRHKVLREEQFYRESDVDWFASDGRGPRWDGPDTAFGCVIHAPENEVPLCLLFNAGVGEQEFMLPAPGKGASWRAAVDTARASPFDICDSGSETLLEYPDRYLLSARSMAILIAGSPYTGRDSQ